MNHALTVLALALLASLALPAWTVAPGAEARAPIRIGAPVAQTGAFAGLGQQYLRGYQLGLKHTNAKDGVLGRPLELILYDNQSDPATAVRLYEQLIRKDKVQLVFSPYQGLITDVVADVTERHKLPMVPAWGGFSSTR